MEVVNCTKHGKNDLVLCCQHLSNGNKDIVYLVPADEEGEAQAWCSTCENARMKDKGWYDYADSVANWKVICSYCLDEIIETSTECIAYESEITPDEEST